MDGLTHIAKAFESAHAEGRAALMPYFTLGYPDSHASLSILDSIAASGADLIELGIPFSDPLADGSTIQHSTQVALEHGASVAVCLDLTAQIRARGIAQPLLLMGYYNPILAYGVERFVSEAAASGADGFIIPDLPPEEASEMETACQRYQRALVYLLAPTSTPERIAEVAGRSTGFVYLVSLTGVTGARQSLPADLEAFISRVRRFTQKPLAVGFGISTPEQAGIVGRLADGVIIGSALINTVEHAEVPSAAVKQFISGMRRALAAV
jgi:tryptophan synthase alpha chain